VIITLPAGFRTVWVGGLKYFSHGGLYYRKAPGGYLAVDPPVGMVVRVLPGSVRKVKLKGAVYYRKGHVYYRKVPSGFMVVEAPGVATLPRDRAFAAGTVSVTAYALNVRSGPGKKHPVIRTIGKGKNLVVRGRKGGWLYVRTPRGEFGWVKAKYTAYSTRAKG
jgi:hypothetical protein